jgi:5-carboxymethyl-2-hydroxymuconate isomerase
VVADSFEIGTAPAQRAFAHARWRLLAGRAPGAKYGSAVLREGTALKK